TVHLIPTNSKAACSGAYPFGHPCRMQSSAMVASRQPAPGASDSSNHVGTGTCHSGTAGTRESADEHHERGAGNGYTGSLVSTSEEVSSESTGWYVEPRASCPGKNDVALDHLTGLVTKVPTCSHVVLNVTRLQFLPADSSQHSSLT